MDLRPLFFRFRWGEKSLLSLYISVLSGVVLALQYDPGTPLYSTSTIDLLAPFGAFWRSLHFYSSQLFFLFGLVHVLAILVEHWPRPIPLSRWLRLIGSLPVAILLLFTGYILRGDITGQAAGHIAENICLSVPLVGHWLNELLFSVAEEGMKRVYANHLIGLGVLWGVLSWQHVRKYRVNWPNHTLLLSGLFLFCIWWEAPFEAERLGVFYIPGPWFFVGLQELLRYFPPFWAGVVFPTTFMVGLGLLPVDAAWSRRLAWFTGGWLLVYTILTVVGLSRG